MALYGDIKVRVPIKTQAFYWMGSLAQMLIYLHKEWTQWIISILWLVRHYSCIDLFVGAAIFGGSVHYALYAMHYASINMSIVCFDF